MLGVDVRRARQKGLPHVAGGEIGLLVKAIPDNQHLPGISGGVRDQSEELLGLGFINFEILHEEDVAGQDALTEGLSERQRLDLFRDFLGVVARVRSEGHAASNPNR